LLGAKRKAKAAATKPISEVGQNGNRIESRSKLRLGTPSSVQSEAEIEGCRDEANK